MNAARRKIEHERECRACLAAPFASLEAAHLWPRSQGASGFDDPDLIVPLCNGLLGNGCHEAFDRHELSLVGLLTVEEEVALVRAAFPPSGRGSGIERARIRLLPFPKPQATAADDPTWPDCRCAARGACCSWEMRA